jgi:hypothetical protein
LSNGEIYGDIYQTWRASPYYYGSKLIGKKMRFDNLSFSSGTYAPVVYSQDGTGSPNYFGVVYCAYYYQPESIKGEITATQNNVAKRAVKVGDKVDINWKATKE